MESSQNTTNTLGKFTPSNSEEIQLWMDQLISPPPLATLSVAALHAHTAQSQSHTSTESKYMLQRFLTVDPVNDPLVLYARLAIREGNVATGGVPDVSVRRV
jgi:hypothetical protein